MKFIRNQLALLRPDFLIEASCVNEGLTEGDILEMGLRLANDVSNYIEL